MQAEIDYAKKCGTSKTPCNPQPKQEEKKKKKWTSQGDTALPDED